MQKHSDHPFRHIHLTSSLSITFAANFIGAVLGAGALFLIARKLSVPEFGTFSIVLVTIRTMPLFASLGLDSSMTALSSLHLKEGQNALSHDLERTAFALRLASSALLGLVLFAAAEPVATRVFASHELIPLFKTASAGVFAASLFNFFKSFLWTHQDFKRAFTFQIVTDIGKFSAILALLWSGKLDIHSAAIAYAATPFIGVLLALKHSGRRLIVFAPLPAAAIKKLISYSKWIFVSEACRTAISSLDLFIVAHLLNKGAAGIYGLAANLMYIFPIFIGSLRSVLIPHIARFSSAAQFKNHIKKTLRYSMLLNVMLVPLLFVSKPVFSSFLGGRYSAASGVFNALLLVNMILPLLTTLHSTLYALKKPRVMAGGDLTRLFVIGTGCWFLTPRLGLLGPPCALFFVNAAYALFLWLYVSRLLAGQKPIER